MLKKNANKSILATAALLAGCFTEVGNPDNPSVKVEMTFSIDYQSRAPAKEAVRKLSVAAGNGEAGHYNDITIDHFYLDVYDAEFYRDGAKLYLQTKEGEDWNDKNGNFLDITDEDSTARMPALYTTSGTWQLFFFSAQVAKPAKIKTDTLDYAAFERKGWMKGKVSRSGGDLDFLYEIPQITRLYLVMRDSTLAKQRTAEGYDLAVAFRARWFRAGIPWDSVTTVKDRNGRSFAYLSASSNGQYYDRLKENFRRSFKVDSAQIDGIEPTP